MTEFVVFLDDLIKKIDPFNRTVTHLHINRKNGEVSAAAPAKDRSLELHAKCKEDVPELEGVACLGSLMYLKQIINSSFVKSGLRTELKFGPTANGKLEALRSITFRGGNRYQAFYQGTDPFIGNIIMPSKAKIESWPLVFAVSAKMAKEFKEARAISAAAPSIRQENVFELSYADGAMVASFGEGNQQSSLVLSDAVEELDKINKRSAYYMTDLVLPILNMCGEDGMIVYFSEKAIKFEFETDVAEYSIIMTSKIVE